MELDEDVDRNWNAKSIESIEKARGKIYLGLTPSRRKSWPRTRAHPAVSEFL